MRTHAVHQLDWRYFDHRADDCCDTTVGRRRGAVPSRSWSTRVTHSPTVRVPSVTCQPLGWIWFQELCEKEKPKRDSLSDLSVSRSIGRAFPASHRKSILVT